MELERKGTAEVMEQKARTAPAQCCVICFMSILNVWIPICNSMALDNLDSDNCEADLEQWFLWHIILVFALPPAVQMVSLAGAIANVRVIFKFGHYLHTASGLASGGMFIWAWILLKDIDDPAKCSKDSDGFDPAEYLKTAMIVTSVAMGILLLCVCIVPCVGIAYANASKDECEDPVTPLEGGTVVGNADE